MIKYIGIIVISLSLKLIFDEKLKRTETALSEGRDFLEFISYLETQVSCFLKPHREVATEFSTKIKGKNPFFSAFPCEREVREVFVDTRKLLSLDEEGQNILDGLFSLLGDGYFDSQKKLIEKTKKDFSDYMQRLEERTRSNTKVMKTLYVTAVLALVIFLI